jgi:hypothetical protein
MSLTAVYMQVPEGYIAFVEELPGANTQGATLEEARENLKEISRIGSQSRTRRKVVGGEIRRSRTF